MIKNHCNEANYFSFIKMSIKGFNENIRNILGNLFLGICWQKQINVLNAFLGSGNDFNEVIQYIFTIFSFINSVYEEIWEYFNSCFIEIVILLNILININCKRIQLHNCWRLCLRITAVQLALVSIRLESRNFFNTLEALKALKREMWLAFQQNSRLESW